METRQSTCKLHLETYLWTVTIEPWKYDTAVHVGSRKGKGRSLNSAVDFRAKIFALFPFTYTVEKTINRVLRMGCGSGLHRVAHKHQSGRVQ